ncbi:DUF4153 domain-containing protein [Moheibacter sp.]|uniref:DUF4153 domain-containing protein n=1 Tax=Moheibacter sp. TaxID=1965316 RepID=UPI003C7772E1
MKNKFHEILLNAKEAIFRYPLVLLMSAIMSLAAIMLIEDILDDSFFLIKIIIVSSIGISLMFALKIFSQRWKMNFFIEILGILYLIGFYFILPKDDDDFTEFYAYLLIPVYILSHLLVSFVAFMRRKYLEINFWQYNKNLFVNFFLTLVFTGVLTGGVLLAVLAVDKLFNVGIRDNLYAEIAVSLLIFGSSFIFLLFNETGLDFLEKEGNYPVVLKFFTQYVLIPLLSIYVVILYFYSGKILINWELPRGWVSYLVLAYSIVGILALLLVHPLKENTDKFWIRIFSKLFYFTLIPLILLLFIAIFTRVLEYGYTEPRYYVLLLALWLSTVVAYFIFRKSPTIKFIPISLFCFGIFALIFPYFNAFSVAKRSQKNELEKILNENNLLVNGKIDFTQEVPDTVAYEIADKFEFLHKRFEKDYVHNYLSEEMQKDFQNAYYWSLPQKFSNRTYSTVTVSSNDYVNLVSKNVSYDLDGFEHIVVFPENEENPVTIGNDSLEMIFNNGNSRKYKLMLNNADSLDLKPLFDDVFKQFKGRENYQKVDELFVEGDLGKYRVKIIFKSINRSRYNAQEFNYWYESPIVLLKLK